MAHSDTDPLIPDDLDDDVEIIDVFGPSFSGSAGQRIADIIEARQGAFDPFSRQHGSFNPSGVGPGFDEGGLTAINVPDTPTPSGGRSTSAIQDLIATILANARAGGGSVLEDDINTGGESPAAPPITATPPITAAPSGTQPAEAWQYNKDKDVFVSTRDGTEIKAGGTSDVPLKDGNIYSVRPIIGEGGGVVAEHVVDPDGTAIAQVDGTGGLFNLSVLPSGFIDDTRSRGRAPGDGTGDAGTGDTGTGVTGPGQDVGGTGDIPNTSTIPGLPTVAQPTEQPGDTPGTVPGTGDGTDGPGDGDGSGVGNILVNAPAPITEGMFADFIPQFKAGLKPVLLDRVFRI